MKEQLQADAKKQGVSSSKLISRYVEEHYNPESAQERDVAIKGLQHELELEKTNTKNLSEQIGELKDRIHGLEKDKEYLQKQLNLVTLRLPGAKEGFWSRVFHRKKKTEEQEA